MTGHRRATRIAAALAFSVLAALSGSSCGSQAGPGERPLTQSEAAVLAQTLNTNHTRGGARFEIATLAAPGGAGLYLSGETDWERHEGAALVSVDDDSAQMRAVYWRLDAVGERRPSLDRALIDSGAPAEPILHRPVDTSRRIDQVIAVLVALATRQAENAQLILQTPGSAFVREDSLRGRDAHVMRYGLRSTYWLDAETGEMLRFEASNAAGTMPLVIDFLALGPSQVRYPPATQLVPWETAIRVVGALPAL